jgi:hypothetical protein
MFGWLFGKNRRRNRHGTYGDSGHVYYGTHGVDSGSGHHDKHHSSDHSHDSHPTTQPVEHDSGGASDASSSFDGGGGGGGGD